MEYRLDTLPVEMTQHILLQIPSLSDMAQVEKTGKVWQSLAFANKNYVNRKAAEALKRLGTAKTRQTLEKLKPLITKLEIHFRKYEDRPDGTRWVLLNLNELTSLKSLSIDCVIIPNKLEQITRIYLNPETKRIKLISRADQEIFQSVSEVASLLHFDNYVDPNILHVAVACRCNTLLTNKNWLPKNREEVACFLDMLQNHESIKKLTLTGITPSETLLAGKALSQNETLQELNLSEMVFSHASMSALGEIFKTNSQLKKIALTSLVTEKDAFIPFFSKLAQNKSLKTLDLFGCKLEKDEIKELSLALMNHSALKILKLTACTLCEHIEDIVSLIENNHSVESLWLDQNELYIDKARQIVEAAASNPILKFLDISSNLILLKDLNPLILNNQVKIKIV